jgi:hypothetical protein
MWRLGFMRRYTLIMVYQEQSLKNSVPPPSFAA